MSLNSVDITQIDRIILKLRQLPKSVGVKVRRDALMKGAGIFVKLIQSKIKDSDGPHTRTNAAGQTVTYYPGNLRKSIQVLELDSDSIFVGPKFQKNARGKSYGKGKRTDAYYAHIYEFGGSNYEGKEPVGKGYRQGRGLALKVIESKIEKALRNQISKMKI